MERRGGLRSPTANRNRTIEANRAMDADLQNLDRRAAADRALVESARGRYTSPMSRARYAADHAAISEARRANALAALATEPADGPAAGNMNNAAPPPPPPPPAAPQGRRRTVPREMSADDLNDISLKLIRGGTPETDVERRIARAMGLPYKKGGLVKRFAAGGMVKKKKC